MARPLVRAAKGAGKGRTTLTSADIAWVPFELEITSPYTQTTVIKSYQLKEKERMTK